MAFSESASIAATVVQSDGKIVVVGNSGVDAFTVARYLGE